MCRNKLISRPLNQNIPNYSAGYVFFDPPRLRLTRGEAREDGPIAEVGSKVVDELLGVSVVLLLLLLKDYHNIDLGVDLADKIRAVDVFVIVVKRLLRGKEEKE